MKRSADPIGMNFVNLVVNGKPEEVIDAIDGGVKVNDELPGGWTPLMVAAAFNLNLDIISVLLKVGAKVDAHSSDSATPVIMKVGSKTPEVIKMYAATWDENRDVKTFLESAGSDYNEKATTPISLRPCRELGYNHDSNLWMVSQLLNAGINRKIFIGGRGKEWEAEMYASDYAAATKNAQFQPDVDLLYVFYKKRNTKLAVRANDGWTPLMFAAVYNQNPDIVTALLKAGAKLDERDKKGLTPLMHAAESLKPEVMTALLLKAGAKITDKDADGRTTLMIAVQNEFNANPAVIDVLLKAGAIITEEDGEERWNPLYYAVKYNPNVAITEALLKAGSPLNPNPYTPLMCAAQFTKNPEIISILLKAGADGKSKHKYTGYRKPVLLTAFDYADMNENVKGTDVYWELSKARF